MSLTRSEKEAVLKNVAELAEKSQSLVIAEYRGLTVAEMTELRSKAREQNVSLSVLKNTLARRALQGTAFEVATDEMTGPLVYGFSEDAAAVAKVMSDFAKQNTRLVLRGGAIDGKKLAVDEVKQLANIPSKEVLLGQLCGLLNAPMTQLVTLLQAPSVRFARVLSAVAQQKA